MDYEIPCPVASQRIDNHHAGRGNPNSQYFFAKVLLSLIDLDVILKLRWDVSALL